MNKMVNGYANIPKSIWSAPIVTLSSIMPPYNRTTVAAKVCPNSFVFAPKGLISSITPTRTIMNAPINIEFIWILWTPNNM